MFNKHLACFMGIIIIVGVSCVFCGTHSAWANQDHDIQVAPAQQGVLSQTSADDFLFGVGYATTNLAAPFADLGALQAKPNYKITRWQNIEPTQPVTDHIYSWDELDAMVLEYQTKGFSETHLTLQSKSPWGAEGECPLNDCKPGLPRSGHWEDYRDYVRAVVERYDHDGTNDMPGLSYPVRQYEIETEADNWWPTPCPEISDTSVFTDRALTYVQLLDSAYNAAHEAYPDVEILPSAMLFYGLFSGEPDAATINARRSENDTIDCMVTFNEEVLRHPELFDAVEFHFLGDDYREIEVTIRWLREQMHLNGYEKPIYPTDLPTAPALVPTSVYTEAFHLYPQDVAKDYLDIIHDNIMTDTVSQEYLDIRTWYVGEQADFTVKLLLSAMEADAAGVQLATMTDFPWMFCMTPTWFPYFYAIWSWGVHGMVDVDWNPFVLCFPFGGFTYEQPRPVFHTLRWFIANLGKFNDVERLAFIPEEPETIEIYAYQVSVEDRSIYVLWAEDGVG